MTGPATRPLDASRKEIAEATTRLVVAGPPLLVVADFDGTLAPGNRDPGGARIEPAAQRALRRLARIQAAQPGRLHVVVLTGRTVPDVVARVRVGGIDYLGDHGLQHGRLPRGGRIRAVEVTTEPGLDAYAATAEHLATAVPIVLGEPSWLYVERKGPSVAFHVRQAEDVARARAAVDAAVRVVERRDGLTDHGLEHYRGRSVVDLRPRIVGGKREAVQGLLESVAPGAVIVLGDELSDVDAFAVVREARTADPALVGITVAVHGSRAAPVELSTLADLHVESSPGVARLLASLAHRLSDDAA